MANNTIKKHLDKIHIKNILFKDFVINKVDLGYNYTDNHPCMLPFILKTENLISILDLRKTYNQIELAKKKIRKIIELKQKLLFISPESKFNDLVLKTANQLEMPVILGNYSHGMFESICMNNSRRKKINFLTEFQNSRAWKKLDRFEKIRITDTIEELSNSQKNIPLKSLPDAIFIVDPVINYQIIEDAQKYDILIFSIVNSNSSPLGIDYLIPANNQILESVDVIFNSIFNNLTQDIVYQFKNNGFRHKEFASKNTTYNSENENDNIASRSKKVFISILNKLFDD